MPEFDPKANGHRLRTGATESLPRRGGGVLLLTLVSALTGLNLMLGAGVGAIVAAVTGAGDATPALAAAGAGLGGAIGVLLGVRVALRFGGSSGCSSVRWLTGWGLGGLVGSIALAANLASPFTPIVAIVLPGVTALIGDRYSAKKVLALSGRDTRKRKLREQETAGDDTETPE